jgi:nucleoside-diphosphate-sugar epimerase
MRYLITGCNGFIGRHIVKKLTQVDTNYVIGVDVSKSHALDHASNFEYIQSDLTDFSMVEALPSVDYVIHLAAINGTSNFYKIPWDVLKNSSVPIVNLLERFGQDGDLKRFFYSSSSEVYAGIEALQISNEPRSENTPVGFGDVLSPRWSYGGAKLFGELALNAYANQFNMRFTIARYHNVYGPDMGFDHVIPDFIARGMDGDFKLFGASNVRSFIYIDDAVEASLRSIHSAETINRIVHVGTMHSISMYELGKLIMGIAGWAGEIEVYPAPSSSTDWRTPNTNFLNEVVGFYPETTLNIGLQKTIEYYEQLLRSR